jgi:hypothetical protein
MSGVPYIFANATTSIPLSELDSNFATPVTIGTTTVGLGNTVTTLAGLSNVSTTVTNTSNVSANTSLLLQTNGGTTAATFDTNQNMGLGVTPSTNWASNWKGFQFGYAGALASSASSGNTQLYCNAINGSTNYLYINNGFATMYDQTGGQHQWFNAPSGNATTAITFTQAMTLDANGNLGLGVTPSAWSSTFKAIQIGNSYGAVIGNSSGVSMSGNVYYGSSGWEAITTGASTLYSQFAGSHVWYNAASVSTGGFPSFIQAMTLDASGQLIIGTSSSSGYKLSVNNSGATPAYINRTTNTGNLIDLAYANSTIGSISTNGSTITYGGTSDYRLKDNVQPLSNALSVVSQLKPCSYVWKTTGLQDSGFLAHEFQSVIPNFVTGVKDAVDAEGNPVYQQMDNSGAIPYLVAAIQELSAQVTTLQAQVTALQAKVGT